MRKYISRINFEKWNCLVKRYVRFKSIYVINCLPLLLCQFSLPTNSIGKPPSLTLGIFKFFIFSNLIREKNVSHCLIHSSSFKEEANCSKPNSSHEPVFKKIYGMSRASSVSTYFALGIHSTVKLERWAMSRKICDT